MLKQSFKLMWNKKKQNFLFFTEILMSFLVIFSLSSFLVYYYQNFTKSPGYDYQRIWDATFYNGYNTSNYDSLKLFYNQVHKAIKSNPQVEEITFTSYNYQYSSGWMTNNLKIKNKEIKGIYAYNVDDYYNKVWNIKLLAGRWFKPSDDINKNKSVIINSSLKEKIFGNENAIGKVIKDGKEEPRLEVIGVIADIKNDGDYKPAGDAMFKRLDSVMTPYISHMLIKVKPNADLAFEKKLYEQLKNLVKDPGLEIEHIENMRNAKNEGTVYFIIISMLIAGFLIINVALGLFGVLLYNIKKRRSEIGLRRAIGATGKNITQQLILESFVITTIALFAGSLFAVQFPLLNVFDLPVNVYIIAMLLSIAFIYTLVFICSYYPGKQAANIHPAIALHED